MEKTNKDGQTLAQFLDSYDDSMFKKPSVTVDSIVFSKQDDKLSILLIQRGNFPCIYDWAFPGGFMNDGETCEETASRELQEETGIEDIFLEQMYTVSTPNRDPRAWIITCCCVGIVENQIDAVGADDAADAKWFEVDVMDHDKSVSITLKSGDIVLRGELDVKRTKSGRINVAETKIIMTDGIAFDHAKLILFAYEWYLKQEK